jgi:hypothetical protein
MPSADTVGYRDTRPCHHVPHTHLRASWDNVSPPLSSEGDLALLLDQLRSLGDALPRVLAQIEYEKAGGRELMSVRPSVRGKRRLLPAVWRT